MLGVLFLIFFLTGVIKVPFFTLWERKVLGYMQSRKGPKKVSFLGIFQPLCDGVKLMVKSSGIPFSSLKIFFLFSPFFKFIFMGFSWILFPACFSHCFYFGVGILYFFCLSSLKVYALMSSGWVSKSKYGVFGAVRGACQAISYEASFILSFLFPACFFLSLSFLAISYEASFILSFLFPACFFLSFLLFLAETNRAPFDFAEGESELVSGFKTEFSSLPFTFLFLAEYGNIVLLSFFFSCFFLSFCKAFLVLGFLVMFLVLLFRSAFPRFRYDFLMELSWKVALPFLCVFFFANFA